MNVFFFQAEDGIRDRTVTGVQTCALPISCCSSGMMRVRACCARSISIEVSRRSEERRVGKEGKSRGAPEHYKKKVYKTMMNAHTKTKTMNSASTYKERCGRDAQLT